MKAEIFFLAALYERSLKLETLAQTRLPDGGQA